MTFVASTVMAQNSLGEIFVLGMTEIVLQRQQIQKYKK